MKKIIALAVVALSPVVALAQTITSDKQILERFVQYGNIFITVIISLAVLYIIYGVFKYLIKGANDEESRKAGRDTILWGVIGLFVILSIWGLVAILRGTFKTDTRTPVEAFPSVGVNIPSNR